VAAQTERPAQPHAESQFDVGGVSPPLPQISEFGGILLARPFKIVCIGPVRLFVEDVERALEFYRTSWG
jgi:hypothetical protein